MDLGERDRPQRGKASMKNNDSEILKWAIGKIESEYKDDVALLVGHGADMQDMDGRTGRFKGEIDYYVPITERANKLSRSFIVDEVCYDIYPRTWESIEAMAALNDCHTACLADATVLYARSEAEREHFERIRAKLFQNLKSRELVLSKARERMNVAREIFLGMIFDQKLYEVRTSAGFILDYLGQSIALFNGRYFHRNALYQLEELESFPQKPEQFTLVYERIIRCSTVNEMKTLCYQLLIIVEDFIGKKEGGQVYGCHKSSRGLADWYQEFSHMWRRIYESCTWQDVRRAFIWGCSLQHELDVVHEEFGLEEMDLAGAFDAGDLSALKARAEEVEGRIVDEIVKSSVRVAIYPTLDDFLESN